jgi:UDP-N-acetylmuramoylalanine--D-glutamate ligase
MYQAEEIRNKKISIIGAARSGLAAARMFKNLGANVFISDKGNKDKLKDFIREFENNGLEYEIGGHSKKVLEADFAVLSPGVPSNSEIILQLISSGKKVYSEIEVAGWFNKSKLIAVTGSNGKTTTTSLIHDIMKRFNKWVFCAGNIGDAFSNYALNSVQYGFGVLEVSSFQLDHIENFHPEVSVICNITPDHMDRYGTFENYANSKARIFKNQNIYDYLVYNYDDEVVRNLVKSAKAALVPFSIKQKLEKGGYIDNDSLIINLNGKPEKVINIHDIRIPGKHNLYNSLAAVLAVKSFEVHSELIADCLGNFEGVEHRLEFVRELHGVKIYNDSKATNVDSVWYALDSFKTPIVLIAGGRDKGNDYSSILKLMEEKVKTAVLIGEAAEKMRKSFTGLTELIDAGSMEEAVKISLQKAEPGDVILLSPACASFDMFDNYEHRGKVFKEIVAGL